MKNSKWARFYWTATAAALIAWLCGLISIGADESPRKLAEDEAANRTAAGTVHRLREGDRLTGEVGTFRQSGNRLTFTSADGSLRLVALENLNLERIARAVGDAASAVEWAVDGTVTEYQGNNYLLVTHAKRKSRIDGQMGKR